MVTLEQLNLEVVAHPKVSFEKLYKKWNSVFGEIKMLIVFQFKPPTY